jgi:opacity protein-like surface antigen
MITRAARHASGFIGFALLSAAASADDRLGLYLGGSVGESHVKSSDYDDDNPACCAPLRFDASRTGWKAFAGVRPLSAVGVEVAYIDFGSATAPSPLPNSISYSDESKESAAAVLAVGYLPVPLPFVDVYGKLGVAWLHTDQRTTTAPFSCPAGECAPYTLRQDQSSTNFAFGAGIQVRLGAFAVRAEYEEISASGGNPDLLSVGMLWRF